MKILCTCFLLLAVLTACHTNTDKKTPPPKKVDTASYYPIEDFFRKQVEYVDLRNFKIQYTHTLDGKKDSAMITKEQFLQWGDLFLQRAQQFQSKLIAFKETVFEDLSTDSYTLNYTPVDTARNEIQNVDVLLDNVTRTAKRVFIKGSMLLGDTLITEQYNWKAFSGFQLTRFKTMGAKYSSAEIISVNWKETK